MTEGFHYWVVSWTAPSDTAYVNIGVWMKELTKEQKVEKKKWKTKMKEAMKNSNLTTEQKQGREMQAKEMKEKKEKRRAVSFGF